MSKKDRKLKPITFVVVHGVVIHKKKDNNDMENQLINAAKVKLAQHKTQGETSNLSIFEVARLMDVVTFGVNDTVEGTSPIFFSFSKN